MRFGGGVLSKNTAHLQEVQVTESCNLTGLWVAE